MARRQHPMEAGERNRLITLTPYAQGVDTSGFPTLTAGTPIDLWASRIDIGGRERSKASQETAAYDTRWEVSYVADLDPELEPVAATWILTSRGREHDVVFASLIEGKSGIEILTLAKAD